MELKIGMDMAVNPMSTAATPWDSSSSPPPFFSGMGLKVSHSGLLKDTGPTCPGEWSWDGLLENPTSFLKLALRCPKAIKAFEVLLSLRLLAGVREVHCTCNSCFGKVLRPFLRPPLPGPCLTFPENLGLGPDGYSSG